MTKTTNTKKSTKHKNPKTKKATKLTKTKTVWLSAGVLGREFAYESLTALTLSTADCPNETI